MDARIENDGNFIKVEAFDGYDEVWIIVGWEPPWGSRHDTQQIKLTHKQVRQLIVLLRRAVWPNEQEPTE